MDYRTILQQFATQGLGEASLVTAPQIQQVMNRLIRKNTHQPNAVFSIEVGNQLWDQCAKDPNGMVNVGEYAQVILDAKDILEGRVRETAEKLQDLKVQMQQLQRELVNYRASGNEAAISGLRGQLQQLERDISDAEFDQQDFNDDYRAVTAPFVEDGSFSRQNISLNRSLMPTIDPYLAPNAVNNSMQSHSQIFMKRSSGALTMIFYLGLLAFFLQLFIMMHKFGFLSIISILAVLAIFGLNYFDRSYVKLTLGLLFASVLLDLFWVFFYMGEYISPGGFSENSTIHTSWLRFTLFLVIVNAVVKAIVFLILMGYRNVQEASSISVMGYSVSLSGECLPLRNWDLVR